MDLETTYPLMAAMLGVASGKVVRSFEIQVAIATNGQKNGYAEESTVEVNFELSLQTSFLTFSSAHCTVHLAL